MEYDLEHQILYILQYRTLIYWGYIGIYITIIPVIIWFIIYADILWACLVVGLIALGALLDIFTFGHLFGKIEKALEVNKELKRLEEAMHSH
jgi:hypothetical protein